MNMNLFARIAEFERLCYNLSKRAQDSGSWRINPETGKMEDTIPPASLSEPTPRFKVKAKEPIMTRDPNMSKMVEDPNMSNPPAKTTPIQPGAHAPVKSKAAPPKPTATPAKPNRQPAGWLNEYMGKDKKVEQATQTLEKQQESNKTQLNSGPSVSNKAPVVKAPVNAPTQPIKIDFDTNPGNVPPPKLDPVKPFHGKIHRN
jgi:hypothetical protein